MKKSTKTKSTKTIKTLASNDAVTVMGGGLVLSE